MHKATKQPAKRPKQDVVGLGISIAALILFVGIAGSVAPRLVNYWAGRGSPPDVVLSTALLLNIALILFAWRHYKYLQTELDERREAEKLARQLANTDPLTGCLNRRSGIPTIDDLIGDARANADSVAVMMVDLDNFKKINDANGHKVGDEVLLETASRIKKAIPRGSVLARLGGDEFACAVRYPRGETDKIDKMAERVIAEISAPIKAGDVSASITLSLGIATCKEGSDCTAEKLLHQADIAMYQAKHGGRNQATWFEEAMETELQARSGFEERIRRGIAQGEFVPYYQQQIDLETGELVGFEMLARWNSPEDGLVSPDLFISVAEETGLICELSEMLIAQALEDAMQWDPRLTLSVNISSVQLCDPWFAQRLLRLLNETGFPAKRFDIEITENCLNEDLGAVRAVITSLKNQGVNVTLDDFGTGYSSLARLKALPFDKLKIDKTFVAELSKEGGNTKFVEAIVSLGAGLDLPVTAEGIETKEVLEALRKFGKLKGQGYLYGRPEDSRTTNDLLSARKLLRQAIRSNDKNKDVTGLKESRAG
ncbi:putative bifunctional diguanylate cyclase/phosphodiesterase [Altericroceibacterium endophyticum]|uniref:EAL domain-containing protein n=1 Tax=Altericroceibacterium endophyticum TaxID=1808508 RepID=A0A6I4T5A4_9SPHN|nr:EAL domain-containing protein [Altericroceibacterium endophyticum]MXO64895.1 EAL domain-containing protein [Altericroceibacterium endophyticum]